MNNRSVAWTIIGLISGGLVTARTLPDNMIDSLPFCILHKTTGFFCVSCGVTRGFLLLSRGRFLEAFSMNILLIPALLFFLYVAAAVLVNAYSGKKLLPEVKFKLPLVIGLLVVAVLFMALRNLSGYPFCLLAPGGITG